MLKATFLEGTINLTIQPDGPILIKAGESGGADPTLPDMEFVRTHHNGTEQIYIPGSSIKGVVRAQCERICRSLDNETIQQTRLEQRRKLEQESHVKVSDARVPLSDNPLGDGSDYRGLDDMKYSSGRYIDSIRDKIKGHPERTAIIYRRSSFVSQIFGHTNLAGRVRFADAYVDTYTEDEIAQDSSKRLLLEERNGVAIDRVYGSVAVGPFNFETAVSGHFNTRVNFKNVTLAQLGLLGLGLRDLAEGRVALGFAKSRGLGRVKITFNSLEIYYPTCKLVNKTALQLLNEQITVPENHFAGLGALCNHYYRSYALPSVEQDSAPLPEGVSFQEDDILGVRLHAEGDTLVRHIWRACMPAWKGVLGL